MGDDKINLDYKKIIITLSLDDKFFLLFLGRVSYLYHHRCNGYTLFINKNAYRRYSKLLGKINLQI